MNLIKLPEFLFCENRTDMPGAGVVLQSTQPWIIGRVVKYSSYQEMAHTIAVGELFSYGVVSGYNICIQFAGTLHENKLQLSDLKTIADVDAAIQRMAQFYLDDRIFTNKGAFNKLLQTNKP